MDLSVTELATLLAGPDLFQDLSLPVHYMASDRLTFKKNISTTLSEHCLTHVHKELMNVWPDKHFGRCRASRYL